MSDVEKLDEAKKAKELFGEFAYLNFPNRKEMA